MTVKVAFKGQRLSKVALCPVPEDTILTAWGRSIENYTESTTSGTLSVPTGNNLYVIRRFSSYNQYIFMINTTGSSMNYNVSVGDLYTWISTSTSSAMETNHGRFGVLSDTDTSEPD